MSAITDAFAAVATSLTAKLKTNNGVFLPISGGRMTGTLEVIGNVVATGDVDGGFVINSQGQMVSS